MMMACSVYVYTKTLRDGIRASETLCGCFLKVVGLFSVCVDLINYGQHCCVFVNIVVMAIEAIRQYFPLYRTNLYIMFEFCIGFYG